MSAVQLPQLPEDIKLCTGPILKGGTDGGLMLKIICMCCEKFLGWKNSEGSVPIGKIEVSHGLCDDCYEKNYKNIANKRIKEND